MSDTRTVTFDPQQLIAALQAAINLVAPGSALGAQLGTLLSLLISAGPAIAAGIVSAEPFVKSIIGLIFNGGKPIPASDFEAQIANLQAQLAAIDAEVAADEAS